MTYLLDVNVLVAWGWSDHVDHERAAAWIGAVRRRKSTKPMTSAIPALGFVRVSVQRAGGLVTVPEATETLTGMVASLGVRHVLLADDQAIRQFPAWCSSASRTTDARDPWCLSHSRRALKETDLLRLYVAFRRCRPAEQHRRDAQQSESLAALHGVPLLARIRRNGQAVGGRRTRHTP